MKLVCIFLLIGSLAFPVNPAPQANLVELSESVPPNFPPSPQSGGSGSPTSYPSIPVPVSQAAPIAYQQAPQVNVPVVPAQPENQVVPQFNFPLSSAPIQLPPANSAADPVRPVTNRKPVLGNYGQSQLQQTQQKQKPAPSDVKIYKRIEEKGRYYSYSYYETPDQIRAQNISLVQCKDPAASPCNYEVGYYQFRSPEGQVVRVDYVSSEDGHVDKMTINPE